MRNDVIEKQPHQVLKTALNPTTIVKFVTKIQFIVFQLNDVIKSYSMMSHTKKVKKGQRTARLILPNGYPYVQLYASQYLLQQFHKNQNDLSKKQNFEKYENNLGQPNNNSELFKYELNEIGISCSNNNIIINGNSIIKEKKLSDKNDISATSISTLKTFQIEHIPKFFNIKGKGSLPTISFVNGKVVLS